MPKQRITREMILETAFQLTRDTGFEKVTTNRIADKMGCSVQPIYSYYKNMEELKKDLCQKAETYYTNCMEKALNLPNPFLGMGLAYINFSRNEAFLFKLLFMSNHVKGNSVFDMINDTDNQEFIVQISAATKLSVKSAKKLYVSLWLTTHGMASMIATNSFYIDNEEVLDILTDTYKGLLVRLKAQEEHAE